MTSKPTDPLTLSATFRQWFCVALFAVLLVAGCGGEDLGDYQRQSLDEIAAERTSTTNAPSVNIAYLNEQDELTTVSHGVEDIVTRTPATADSLYRVGSITKSFVAARILQLVEDGHLALGASLQELLPEQAQLLSNFNPDRVQLYDLLQHTSRICSFTAETSWSGKFTADPTYRWGQDELLTLVADKKAADCNEEGQTWHYSNSNYVLLGLIIEKYDPLGRSYGQNIREEILEPLGLTRTFVPSYDFPDERPWIHGYHNWGYNLSPLVDITTIDWSFTWASGEMVSTPSDLSRWVKSLMTPGVVLAAETLEWMTQTIDTGLEGGYKYGLGVMEISMLEVIGHGAGHPGFDCTAQYVPEFDEAVAMCVNRTFGNFQKSDTAFLGSVLRSIYPQKNYPIIPGTILKTE